MRDPITINAICGMIQHRKQIADIPNTCGGEAGLLPAIRQFCESHQLCFSEETESRLFDDEKQEHIPDWDALIEITKQFCLAD